MNADTREELIELQMRFQSFLEDMEPPEENMRLAFLAATDQNAAVTRELARRDDTFYAGWIAAISLLEETVRATAQAALDGQEDPDMAADICQHFMAAIFLQTEIILQAAQEDSLI